MTFEATPFCDQGEVTYQWTNLETAEVFHTNPITLTVDRTTELELQVSDESGSLVQQSLWILFPSSGVLDLNGDGFNTLEDLLSILPEWNTESLMDLNGDGIVNILDLLYVYTGH